MNPALYQLNGALTGARYLPGQYRWLVDVQLSGAIIECVPPSSGALTLTLEVNGVLTSSSIVIGPVSGMDTLLPQGRVRRTLNLGVLVPAGQPVRWYASFDGGAEDAPQAIALTIVPIEQSVTGVTSLPSVLDVRLANGSVVAVYDTTSGAWNVTSFGTASGVAITTGAIWQLTWNSQVLLTVQNGVVEVGNPEQFIIGSGTVGPRTEARLQFCINGTPVMGLSSAGLRTVELVEVKTVPIDTDPHFEFWSDVDGTPTLTATLDGQGMAALEADEV